MNRALYIQSAVLFLVFGLRLQGCLSTFLILRLDLRCVAAFS